MGTRIQLTPEQSEREYERAVAAAIDYNKAHEDTRMFVRQLPGGNVQIIIQKL